MGKNLITNDLVMVAVWIGIAMGRMSMICYW
jgi:hypothetical protein